MSDSFQHLREVLDENEPRLVPPPTDPMAVARQFVAERYTDGEALLLRHHRNTFYRYVGDHYPEDDERRVRSELWHWLETAQYAKGEALVPFEPNRHKIANVLEALKAIGHIAEGVQPPVWLEGDRTSPIIAGEVVPLANGILRFSTRELQPHTPALFEQHVLPFDYDPKALDPQRWLSFLDQLWGDDEGSKQALAEWFGYVLSNDTSQQKMYLLVGPKRSGKGTIARVLTGLLGAHNAAAPTLAGLTQNFGLQPLVGRPLAVVSDARLGSRADNMVAVERLLSISGEDTLTIDRKYRDPWTGRLPTRFMILTNELPRFSDSSGALASRFVMSILRQSFYGRENPALTLELLEESAGIFNWALEGLDRLRARGYFTVPTSAREAQRQFEDLASPVGAFVRDLCEVGPAFAVDKNELWKAWKEWCTDEGRERPGTKAVFARDLRATVPGLVSVRPRDGEARSRGFQGIKLAQQWETPRTTPDQGRAGDPGPGSPDVEIPVNHAGGPGWSGVEPTVIPSCGHSQLWLARDGRRRCLHCDPPAFPSEVVAEEPPAA
jgi:putative DNA primase/helicase